MIQLDARQIEAACPLPILIDDLEVAFRSGLLAPPRFHVPVPGGDGDRLFLMMPAFAAEGGGMVKCVNVFPDNRERSIATIQGAILAFDERGAPKALLDGGAITRLRTAAASALAARLLARADSRRLLVIGTGALAPYMAAAHACARPIRHIAFWGRDPQRVAETVAQARGLISPDIEIEAAEALALAVQAADIVSCATSASEPVLEGEWLRAGTHVDLVGAFSPDTRECDDETVRRGSIFVDTMEGAMAEAGDILQPLARGVIRREQVRGDFYDLTARRVEGRRHLDEITMFKSVGSAVEDLAAVQAVMRRLA
nr:ornithine cyclodeaminase family protein [Sphingomonas sp. Y57]